MYLAFGFTVRPKGGLNDLVGVSDNLQELKDKVEKAANSGEAGYWGSYYGHIATYDNDQLVIKERYVAIVRGNVYAGKVYSDIWTDDDKVFLEFIGRIR